MGSWRLQGWDLACSLAPIVLVATWGCGSGSSAGTTSGSDGGSATGGSAAGGSAAGSGAAGSSAAAGDGGSGAGSGTGGDGGTASSGAGGRELTIQLYDIPATNGAHLTLMDTTPDSFSGCTTLRQGSCAVATCLSKNEGASPADDVWFSGGEVVTVTIDPTAGERPTSSATMELQPMTNFHSQAFSPHTFLTGEQQITVDISGGTLPPYRYTTELPRLLITTSEPDELSAGQFNVDYVHLSRQADQVLAWQGGAPHVTYGVWQKQWKEVDGKWYLLSCSFASTLGTGTISKQLLADLPTGTEFYTLAVIDDFVPVDGGTYRFLTYADTVNPSEQNTVGLKLTD